MPITADRAPDVLPGGAKSIYVGAFNSAYIGTCKSEGDRRDECASRIAWAAVKRKYKKGAGTAWVRKNGASDPDNPEDEEIEMRADLLTEGGIPMVAADFIVTKASSSAGSMRWVARASDTLRDDLDSAMTRELFENFIQRSIDLGMPYLGVAHYGSLSGNGVAGTTDTMWIDGIAFKAKGTFEESSLGRALFGTIVRERNDQTIPEDHRVRLSIGFLDLRHSHGNYVFTRASLQDTCPLCAEGNEPTHYYDGVLIHFGATRVPINVRTSIDAEQFVARSGTQITRLEDAASIVGEDLAERLQSLTKGLEEEDREAERAMVVKGEGTDPVDPIELARARLKERATSQEVTPMTVQATAPAAEVTPVVAPVQVAPPPEETPTEVVPAEVAPTAVPAPVAASPVVAPAPAPTPAPDPAPVVVLSEALQPVVDAMSVFQAGVLASLQNTDLEPDQRLLAIQPMLETMSAAIIAGAQDEPTQVDQLAGAIRSALAEELRPLITQTQLLLAHLGGGAQVPASSARRTFSHVLVPDPAAAAPAKPGSIRSIARRSVGLED